MKFTIQVALSVIFIIGAFVCINYTTDDPFITFRYSENLIHGCGLAFNPGERIEGFSNPTWLLIMGVFAALTEKGNPLTLLWISKFLGIQLAAASVLIIYSAERRVHPERIPIASLVMALNPCLFVWSVGGLETTLCTFLVALVLYDELVNKNGTLGAAAMGILAVSRPEMPLLLIVYLLLTFPGNKIAQMAVKAKLLVLILPAIFWLVFRILYFSDIFPNTYYAKATSHDLRAGFLYLTHSFILLNFYYFLTPASLAGFIDQKKPGVRFASIMTAAYFFFIVFSGGDWMPAGRFLVHILPLTAWITAGGVFIIFDWLKIGSNRVMAVSLILVMLLGLVPSMRYIHSKFGISPYPWESLSIESPVFPHYLEMGKWLGDNSDNHDVIALGEAGLIPYIAGNRVIDCFGLLDKHIARLPGKMHIKFDPDYVMEKEPEYILLLGEIEGGKITTSFTYCRQLFYHRNFGRYHLEKNIRNLYLYKLNETYDE